MNYLGEIYFKEKDYKKAKDSFVKSTMYDNTNPNPYINLGKYFAKIENNFEFAEAEYKKCLAIEKTNKKGGKKLAKLYISFNKYDDADKIIAEFTTHLENEPKTILLFANFYYNKNKHDNAIAMYERVLKNQP